MAAQKRRFNINEIPYWSFPAQAAVAGILGLFLLLIAYFLVFRGQREELAAAEGKEASLRKEFSEKAGKAANLDALKRQLAEMEKDLQQMLQQLPSKTEMPNIITNISQAALASGLSEELFKPAPEFKKEIYAEQPIEVAMRGTFHQFGAFMSAVASLPQVVIMTMNNVQLTPDAKGGLKMAGTIKTYRYLDDSEKGPPPKLDKNGKPVPAPAGGAAAAGVKK